MRSAGDGRRRSRRRIVGRAMVRTTSHLGWCRDVGVSGGDARARGGSRPGSGGPRGRSRGRVVSASMSSSSVPAISARSVSSSAPTAWDSTVWCGPPAVSQASADVARSGAGRQTARATGSLGSGSSGGDDLDLVGDEPEPVTQVAQAEHDRRAGCRVEDQPDRVLPAADAQRVDLAASGCRPRCVGQTSSMCAPRIFSRPGRQLVGVVLHERRAAGHAGRHRLDRAHQHRGLPVALAAEAVAVGHQPLHREPGQLAQAAEVLEVGGERAEAAGGRGSRAGRPRSGPRSAATRAGRRRRAAPGPAGSCRRTRRPARRPRLVGDRVDDGDQVVDAVGVDRDAEAQLRLDLVALGDRDVAHVVAEPGQPQRAHLGQAARRPHPGADPARCTRGSLTCPATVLRAHAAAGSGCSRTPGRRARPG